MPVSIACMGRGLFGLFAVALIAAPARGQADPSGVTWDEKIEVASGGGLPAAGLERAVSQGGWQRARRC